jgi:hypothetical protein
MGAPYGLERPGRRIDPPGDHASCPGKPLVGMFPVHHARAAQYPRRVDRGNAPLPPSRMIPWPHLRRARTTGAPASAGRRRCSQAEVSLSQAPPNSKQHRAGRDVPGWLGHGEGSRSGVIDVITQEALLLARMVRFSKGGIKLPPRTAGRLPLGAGLLSFSPRAICPILNEECCAPSSGLRGKR